MTSCSHGITPRATKHALLRCDLRNLAVIFNMLLESTSQRYSEDGEYAPEIRCSERVTQRNDETYYGILGHASA